MKKILSILVMTLMVTSCGKSLSRDELFEIHTKALVDEEYQLSDTIPFDVTGRYVLHQNNNYQMELIFDRALTDFEDITILIVDGRQEDYKEPPLNVGYFNPEKLNFIDDILEINSQNQKAFRFTWYSDSHEVTMKILFTHELQGRREEIFFKHANFALYSEVAHGY